MSQLIKKLKATQSQNTFVTPEAAAKIISSSGRKSKRNYRTFWSIVLMTIIGIGGYCFWGVKKKSVQQFQDVQLPVAPKIKIALEPLQVSPKEPLKLEDSYEAFVSSVESTNMHKSFYEQGASLYIKDFPEFVPSLGSFISKYLDPYLKNCTQIAQQVKKIKRPHIVHKKTSPKPASKIISLKDAIPVANPVHAPQEKRFQVDYNEQDDWVITAPRLTEAQQQHLEGIHKLLNQMQIESVREEGSQSRLKANGHIYHPNALISMKPRLTWMGIQHNELIFYDEYKQEYRKKIAQN